LIPIADLNRIEILCGTVRLISKQPNLTGFQSTVQRVLSGADGGGFNHNDRF
jgi:hypothetical protein